MKVAVVGLGITGLSNCARLAKAGHDVAGLEQFSPQHDRGSSHGDTRIFRLTPGEGEIYVGMAQAAKALWLEWEREASIRLIEWMPGVMAGPPGSAFVASCEQLSAKYGHEYLMLPGEAVAQATQGAMQTPADWRACIQADWRACIQKDCGVFQADATRRYLEGRTMDAGAQLTFGVPVEGPVLSTTLFVDGVATQFDAIILSAGPWTSRVAPEVANVLTVERRVLAWYKPRAELTQTPPVLCADSEAGLFGMPPPDGLYKIGFHRLGEPAQNPDHVRAPDARDTELLSAQVARHLPLHEPFPVRAKQCLYTLTADENFLVAPSREDPNVLIFSCCSGHGFKYAPVYGEIALDWIAGRGAPEAFANNAMHAKAFQIAGSRQ